MTRGATRWSIVVPVKRLANAKTRLDLDVTTRAALAVAMAVDTVTAAISCDLVGAVVVVTDDSRARQELEPLGVSIIPDAPDAGLNAALRHGAASTPAGPVCALSSDLPALRSHDLGVVLEAAAAHRQAVVADLPGTGTTAYFAASLDVFAPRFGIGSRDLHVAAGAVDVTAASPESVRRDVDTIDALAAAVALGVGPATQAVLAATGVTTQ
jgi:2-phospho-L-lactate guanylyltransferase